MHAAKRTGSAASAPKSKASPKSAAPAAMCPARTALVLSRGMRGDRETPAITSVLQQRDQRLLDVLGLRERGVLEARRVAAEDVLRAHALHGRVQPLEELV